METINNFILLDVAVIIILSVLCSLSRKLGDALKIRPYYKFFYLGISLIVCALLVNALSSGARSAAVDMVAVGFRLSAGIVSVMVCLRYWQWLFPEYFKK